jgi:hypothetical protein
LLAQVEAEAVLQTLMAEAVRVAILVMGVGVDFQMPQVWLDQVAVVEVVEILLLVDMEQVAVVALAY